MIIVKSVSEITAIIDKYNSEGVEIGFVPTMGALHQGHLELVRRCVSENKICIVSIFVNPTQFNDKNDYIKYPRTIEDDCNALNNYFRPQDIVFIPEEKELIGNKIIGNFDFGNLESVMEGKHRPGHFKGVGFIVYELFKLIKPVRAYFGEKDYQQLQIIKCLVSQFNLDISIIACPTIRETDGLAMSSRNVRLTNEHRLIAPKLYKTLLYMKKRASEQKDVKQLIEEALGLLLPPIKVEYIEIVDQNTLEASNKIEDRALVCCLAAKLGDVRLIDNIIINN